MAALKDALFIGVANANATEKSYKVLAPQSPNDIICDKSGNPPASVTPAPYVPKKLRAARVVDTEDE